MTEKLYYSNPYTSTFEATVTTCIQDGDTYLVELSQTAFYPEGGGQPSDSGTLGSYEVLDVSTAEERILHRTSGPYEIGEKVTGCLNWPRRFNHMQQHLGQHLLSAAFKRLFDAATVGFHMGDDYVTIDLDQKLSAEEVCQAEDLANQAIYDNYTVEALYPENDDLAELPLRKMPKVTENIRIIKAGEYDHTPCGGTHPSSTGEVGLIKVRKFFNHKSGIRVDFVCGRLALLDYREKLQTVTTLAADLSVKDSEVIKGYERLKQSLADTNDQIRSLKLQLSTFEAQRLLDQAQCHGDWKLVVATLNGYDMNDLRNISSVLATHSNKVIRLLLSPAEDKTTLLIDIPENNLGLSAKVLLKLALDASGGKGGGSEKSAQGASANGAALEATLPTLIENVLLVLSNGLID